MTALASARPGEGARVLPASERYAAKSPASHVRLAHRHAAPSAIAEALREVS